MKRYITAENGQELQIDVYYNKGGMNYFTSRVEKRGFYISVCPVQVTKHENGLRSVAYTAFTGVKLLLLEVNRFSKSAEAKANELAKDKEQELIQHILSGVTQ